MKFQKLIIPIFFLIGGCQNRYTSQPENKTIEQFGWTITIPKNFRLLDDNEWGEIEKKGEAAIEKTFDAELINEAKTIFAYKNGQLNTLESNWQPFDMEIDGDYISSCYEVNGMVFQTMEAQIPNVKIDSSSSIQKIDGLDFHRFDMKIDLPNGIKMTTVGLNRLFGKKDLTINITYVEKKVGDILLASVLKSKFE